MGFWTVACLSLSSDPTCSGTQEATDHGQNTLQEEDYEGKQKGILKEYVEIIENIQCNAV